MKQVLIMFMILSFSSSDFKKAEYKLGEKVQDFALLNALDNSTVSLSNLLTSKGVVIIFINRECPYSKVYESRIQSLAAEYSGNNIDFILISTGHDKAAALSAWANETNWIHPVLMDPRKEVSKRFGATKTPEAFVLKNLNGSFYIKYKGAIDDNPQTEKHVTNSFLRDAVSAIVTDGPVKIQEKRATGCIIR